MTLMDRLRPYLARLVGTAVASFCGWLLLRYGVDVDKDTQAQLAEAIVVIVIPLMLAAREITHKGLNKIINPGDTASAHLAVAGKNASAEAKRAEKTGELELPPPDA